MATTLQTYVVEIYEPGMNYPAVVHFFNGRTREEAMRYHDAHLRSDSYIRGCEANGTYGEGKECVTKTYWTTTEASGRSPLPSGRGGSYGRGGSSY